MKTLSPLNHQRLMETAYELWRGTPEFVDHPAGRLLAADQLGPLYRAAVQLGNLHHQIHNGGFDQWYLNGFAMDTEDIRTYINMGIKKGIPGFNELDDVFDQWNDISDNMDEGVMETCHCLGDDPDCYQCDGSGEYDDGYDEERTTGIDNDYYAISNIEDAYQTFLNTFND